MRSPLTDNIDGDDDLTGLYFSAREGLSWTSVKKSLPPESQWASCPKTDSRMMSRILKMDENDRRLRERHTRKNWGKKQSGA